MSTRFVSIVASSLAALAVSGAAQAALPRAGLFATGQSLGGLRPGATERDVRRVWGDDHGVCRSCNWRTWYFTYRPFAPQGAGIAWRRGRVAAVFTLWSPRGWRSSEGVRIGDDVARVTTVYGPLPRSDCGTYYGLELLKNGLANYFYVVDRTVWGFGLSLPAVPACH